MLSPSLSLLKDFCRTCQLLLSLRRKFLSGLVVRSSKGFVKLANHSGHYVEMFRPALAFHSFIKIVQLTIYLYYLINSYCAACHLNLWKPMSCLQPMLIITMKVLSSLSFGPNESP